MTECEKLLDILMDDSERTHVNIKFFRGRSESIQQEALCTEIVTAIFERKNGLLDEQTGFDEQFKEKDVRELALPA